MSAVAVLAAAVPQQDRTGPTIVFVVTILVVVVLLGVMIRRASKSAPDSPTPAPDDPGSP